MLSLVSDFESQPKRASMRVNQLWSWIYCHGMSSFDNMTNIDKSLRSKLQKVFNISRPAIEKKEISDDGTIKYLFCLEGPKQNRDGIYPRREKKHSLHFFTSWLYVELFILSYWDPEIGKKSLKSRDCRSSHRSL